MNSLSGGKIHMSNTFIGFTKIRVSVVLLIAIFGLAACNSIPKPVEAEIKVISENVIAGTEQLIKTEEAHPDFDKRSYQSNSTFKMPNSSTLGVMAVNGDLRWVFSHSWDKALTVSSEVKKTYTLTVTASGSYKLEFDAEVGVYKVVKVTANASFTVTAGVTWSQTYNSCRTKNTVQTHRYDRYYQEKYYGATGTWKQTGGYSDSNKRLISETWSWVGTWSPC
jgi:hypothetical protein